MANGRATWQHKLEATVVQGIQGNLRTKSWLGSRCQRIHPKIYLFILVRSLTIRVARGVVVPDKYHHNHTGRTKRNPSSPIVIFYESLSIMEQLTVTLPNLNETDNFYCGRNLDSPCGAAHLPSSQTSFQFRCTTSTCGLVPPGCQVNEENNSS